MDFNTNEVYWYGLGYYDGRAFGEYWRSVITKDLPAHDVRAYKIGYDRGVSEYSLYDIEEQPESNG